MKKPALNKVSSGKADVDEFASRVKQALEHQHGQHPNAPRIEPLPAGATTAELVAAFNALLERVQGS